MTEDHYFSSEPASPGERFGLRVRLAGRDLTLESARGVFSSDRLDLGTSVLLSHASPPPTGNLLDLGCGWGPIAITLGLLSPASRVWAVDVNLRALDLTRKNVEAVRRLEKLAPIEVRLPEDVPPDLEWDAIWSNPPIRIGKEAVHRLLATWLPRLAPGGEALLVVQRHLGSDSMAEWLAAQEVEGRPWGTVEKVGSSKGFRVLRLTKPGD